MQKYFVIALLCASSIAARPINSQGQEATSAGEVSIGGSKLWEHAGGGLYHDHGLELAVTCNFNRFLGLETDFSKFGNSPARAPAYGDYFRLLLGPHFAYNANSHVSPFAHVLAGGTRGRQCPPTSSCYLTSDEIGGNAFTVALGGGLDVEVFRFFWVRPIQADYVQVSFPNATENNLRLSFGVTLRFGSPGKNRKDEQRVARTPAISSAAFRGTDSSRRQ